MSRACCPLLWMALSRHGSDWIQDGRIQVILQRPAVPNMEAEEALPASCQVIWLASLYMCLACKVALQFPPMNASLQTHLWRGISYQDHCNSAYILCMQTNAQT